MQVSEKNSDVLIVGAGPSGLMMACQLAIHGIRFRIIDKRDGPSIYSGALIVHARSIEILDQMGIAGKAIQESIIADDLSIIFNGKKEAQISLNDIGQNLTKFPNLYLIEQTSTEQILIDFVTYKGYAVERNTELKSFGQDEHGVSSVLKLPDGKEETINTMYLVAADGGHSTVRQKLNISFVGKSHPVSLFIIDCKAEVNVPPKEICFSFSNAGTFGIFPMKNARRRIDGVVPLKLEGNPKITFENIEKNFAERIFMKIRLYSHEWFSVSHSQQRYALSYQRKRCFLIGDAAHTFTPVGAQGMNTGLQDAYNLGWKLGFVINGKANNWLLNTYSAERKTIAKKLVKSTGRVYNMLTNRSGFVTAFRLHILPIVLKWLLPLIQKKKIVRQFCFNAISEIGISYRNGPLTNNASLGNFPANAPEPGDRLPYFVFREKDTEINLHEKVSATAFTLLFFSNNFLPVEIIRVAKKYKNILTLETVPFSSTTKVAYDWFGNSDFGCFLVRPDMHIAYRSNIPEAVYFESYLQQYLNAN